MHKLSFSEAITVKLLSLNKLVELSSLGSLVHLIFFLPTFGPIEIKAIDLTSALVLAICIIIMLLIFDILPSGPFQRSFSFSWVCVCSVTEVNSTLWPWGPGLNVVRCQLKDIYLIQITDDEIAVSVYKVKKALKKCFSLVRKIVWIKSMAVGYIVYGKLYLACNWLELWCTDDVLLKSKASNAMILGYSFCIFILV